MKTMEQIINQIIEIEMSARKIVNEAKDDRDHLDARISAELDAIRARRMEAAQAQLEAARAHDAEALAKKIEEVDHHYEIRLRALEHATKDNLDIWVDEIFSNIVNADR